MSTHTPAEVFPVGEYLRDELDERGWTVTEFAEILGRPVQAVSEILNGKKEITTDTAISIGEALGTTPKLWLNLQTTYRLHQQQSRKSNSDNSPVSRRARLRRLVPLAEIRRRGWIPDTKDLDDLETAVCNLLEIDTIDNAPSFAIAARRSNSAEPISIEQTAWLGHIRRLAELRQTGNFTPTRLAKVASQIPSLLADGPQHLPTLPDLLAEAGVALVFAKGLRGGKLDGAVTFLPDTRPVIGLTTRGNRFDTLVFNLLHECAHLTRGHITPDSPAIIDDDILASEDPNEIDANQQASDWLFPTGFSYDSTRYASITALATKHKVHPSMVIGRIQHETGNYKLHRNKIPKVWPDLINAGLLP